MTNEEVKEALWSAYRAGHGPDSVGALMELRTYFEIWYSSYPKEPIIEFFEKYNEEPHEESIGSLPVTYAERVDHDVFCNAHPNTPICGQMCSCVARRAAVAAEFGPG